MSNPSDSHLHRTVDEPAYPHYASSSNSSSEMEKPPDVVGQMVRDFLATRESRSNARADVVFDRVSVEGSGTGVSCSSEIEKGHCRH